MIGKAHLLPGLGTLPRFSGFTDSLKRHRMLSVAAAALLILAITAGTVVATRGTASAAYQTQPVVRQDLTQTVTASGTVNPQNTVNVGTQVSGTIQSLSVDFNSKVKKGQILARLDPSQLQAQLAQAQATLAQAQAQASAQSQTAGGAQAAVTVAQQNSAAQASNAQAAQAGIATAQANVVKAQSAAQLAQQTVSRDRTLVSQGYLAQSQFDADQSTLDGALSGVQSAQAALVQARAQAAASLNTAQASSAQSQVNAAQAGASQDTAQAAQASVMAAQAQVQQDQLNLDRAVITSPVDGTVIARSVSVGQTVAASLTTPTLFTIAQDLRKMEVDISVGEPDIGNVRPGDVVTFSVLAYPNQNFSGTVSQVRVNSATVNNVVTYTVITLVNNKDNKLLPGMTANATIGVQTVKNALVVPLQALSFRPASGAAGTHSHRGASAAAGSGAGSPASASPWGATSAGAGSAVTSGKNTVIFVQRAGKAQPVRVRVDLISGTQAAVTPTGNASLQEGDAVITADASSGSRAAASHAAAGNSPAGVNGLGRAIH